jgi:hypothetical protein
MKYKLKKFLVAGLIALGIAGAALAAEINDLNTTDASNTARFPENMAPSAVNDGARALEGLVARWHNDINCSNASSGSSNAYVLAADQTIGALYDGLILCFDANFANTDSATLDVDSQGAKTIVKNGDAHLIDGDIIAGQKVYVVYDGAAFQLLSIPAQFTAATDSVGANELEDNGVSGDKIAMGSDAQGDILFYNTTDYARLGAGTSGQFLQTQGSGADPQWASVAQAIEQITGTQTGAVATGTTTVPFDDSIPQCDSEGDEYMTLAITPTDVDSTLFIDVVFFGATTNNTGHMTVFLCQDSTADALAVTATPTTVANTAHTVSLHHRMTAATTSETTFKVRAGPQNAGTVTFNGVSGARRYGGKAASSITIEEALP